MSSSRLEEEFQELDRLAAWPLVFQKLRNDSLAFQAVEVSVQAARHPQNRSLNRYRDVSPYDHSRVILQEGEIDYINASIVEGCALATPAPSPSHSQEKKAPDLQSAMGPCHYRRYILTQGPLPATAGHFWQMVWEQRSLAIVMLNKVIEKGAIKCTQYWPISKQNGELASYLFDDTGFRVTLLEEEDEHYFVIRRLLLEHLPTGSHREVLHFHYTTWPDFGVPESPSAFLHFLLAVRESGALEPEVGPPIVHCSAGIGRSGTFCLVDSALVEIEKKKSLDAVDVQSLLMHMRTFRMGLIQTFEQLRFSYLAIIHGGHRILTGRFTRDDLLKDEDVDDEIEEETSEEEEEVIDVPPPLPPTRVESLSPASERKFLQQQLAAAAEKRREEDNVPGPLPLPKKQKMALDVNKMARPGSSDTLSIDEGFVDVQTPVMDSDAQTPTVSFGSKSQLRQRQATSLDANPAKKEARVPPSHETSETSTFVNSISWKWLVLPPVLILGYLVYRYCSN